MFFLVNRPICVPYDSCAVFLRVLLTDLFVAVSLQFERPNYNPHHTRKHVFLLDTFHLPVVLVTFISGEVYPSDN